MVMRGYLIALLVVNCEVTSAVSDIGHCRNTVPISALHMYQ